MVPDVIRLCAVPSGPEADTPQHARKERNENIRKMLKIIPKLEERRVPD